MIRRSVQRLDDILEAIENITKLLHGLTVSELQLDAVKCAAFERFLEIISEASRHVPQEMKSQHSEVPWPKIASLGDNLRHAYHRVEAKRLWAIYESGDLKQLREAATQMRRMVD